MGHHTSDADLPANRLSLALDPGAPPGMTIDATGLVQWTVGPGFAGTTNRVTVRVTDDGVPSRSATQTFSVIVNAQAPLRLSVENKPEGGVRLSLLGDIGRTYFIEATSDLKTWTLLTSFVSEKSSTEFLDGEAQNSRQRFYRAITP